MANPFDQFDAPASASNPFDQFDEAPKPAGMIRKIADKGLGFASGAVGATKALADAVGAGNVVSDTLESANTGLNDYLSPEEKASQQAQSARTEQAKGTGTWNEFKAGFQNFTESPIQKTVTGAGSIVPVALAALGGLPAAVATGVGMGVGTVKGRIYDDTKKRGIDAGLSVPDAEAKATKAQDYTGENADQIALGGGLGALDALTGVGRIAGGALRNAIMKPAVSALPQAVERGMLGRAAMGALGEVPLEAAQGGQEQLATNIAAQRQGVNTGTWDGVVGQATEEGLASLGMGAGVGALHTGPKAQAPAPEVPPSPAPLQIGNTPDPYLSFPDGTVGRRAEVDAYINALPADQQPAARAKIMGLAPQPTASAVAGIPITEPGNSFASILDTDPVYSGWSNVRDGSDRANMREQMESVARTYAQHATPEKRDQLTQELASFKWFNSASAEQKTSAVDALIAQSAPAQPAPVKPSEAMGLNAASGPLSSAAVVAVDTGAHQPAFDKEAAIATYRAETEALRQQQEAQDAAELEQAQRAEEEQAQAKTQAATRAMLDQATAPVYPTADELLPAPAVPAKPEGSFITKLKESKDKKEGQAEAASGNSSTQEADAAAKKEPENQPQALEPLAQSATENVANTVTQPVQTAMGEGAGGSQPTQVALPKPKTASKADLDHLFGVDQKRAKAIERIANGAAYFSKPLKAQEFIAKNGLKETHQSVKTARGWDIVAKVSQPATGNTLETIDQAAHNSATSPLNDLAQPTDGQKKAGNYAKGHVMLGGLDLSIENPAGSVRSGKDKSGKPWSNTLNHHYGYIKGTMGNDKDHVDLFVKPETPLDYSGQVFVIDQVHPETGRFDEHKVMVGFPNILAAKAAYMSNYAKGWKGMKAVTPMAFNDFKSWVKAGPKNVPLAQDKSVSQPTEKPSAQATKTQQVQAERPPQGTTAATTDKPTADSGVAAAGQAEVAKKPVTPQLPQAGKMPEAEGVWVSTGRSDFKDGKPRVLPSYFTKPGDKNSKDWYRGWDAANAAKPVAEKPQIVTDKAEMRPYHKPDGSVGYEAVPIQAETPVAPKATKAETLRELAKINEKMPEGFEAADGPLGVGLFQNGKPVENVQGLSRVNGYSELLRQANLRSAKPTTKDEGQNDELDAEMRSYEAKADKPAAPAAKPDALTDKEKAAKAKMFNALGKLAALAGKNTKMNWTQEEEQQILPIVIELFDGAMDLGAVTFQKAVRYVREFIASGIDQETADSIPFETLQGAYIATSGRHKDKAVTPKREVAAFDSLEELDKSVEKVDATKTTLETTEGRHEIAKLVADHLITSKFSTIIEARKFITDKTDTAIEPGTDAAKRADEAIELGVVLASRDVVQAARKQGRSDAVIFDRLLGIHDNQPSLNVRDSVSLRNQAYSTPVPLAFAASRLAGVTPDKLVGEPSAGNGALMMEANPATSTTNEIQDDRLEALKSQGFSPTQNDAAVMKFKPKSLDVMVMNPPFGAVNGQKWTFGEFTTGEIDHAIVMNSLVAMKDDGSAVLIIGGTLAREDAARKDAYRGKAKREFFYKLYSEYNVVDHFTASGDLYKKQGAAYPVDVLVIRGRGKSARGLPAAQLPQLVDTWDQLKGKLNEMDGMGSQGPGNTRGGASNSNASNEPGGVPTPVVGPSAADGTASRPAGTGSGIGTDDRGGTAAASNSPRGANGTPNPDGQQGNDAAPSQNGNTRKPAKQGSGQQQSSTGGNRPNKPAGLDNRSDQQPDSPGIAEAASTGRLQVKYGNFSDNRSVNTLVATNHLSAIESAFKVLQARVGDIDEFVRAELQYEPDQFEKAFSAEQVEALALAIDNIGQGKGFIIGDQTGIGKGRVVAAMIRYAKLNGKVPVFVTQMPDLYGDMMRDLNDIGMTQTRPLMTNNNASVPLDAEALAWFSEKQAIQTRLTELQDEIETVVAASMGDQLTSMTPAARSKAISDAAKTSTLTDLVALREEVTELKAAMPARRGKFLDTPDIKTHEAMLQQMVANNSIGDNDVIFTTYNQMSALDSGKPKKDAQGRKTPASAPTFGYRNTFLKHFINANTMLILDESHNAGAAGDGKFPKLGDIVRGLINQSGGVFYSSATFAKNTEVMDVYSKTDLGSAFSSPSELVRAVNSVPMQQITSAMLVEAGQYLRRERSFDGIEYKTETVEVDKQAAEDLATAMRLVVAFDAAKIAGIADIQNQLDAEGAAIATINGGGSAASVESTNFTSVMHNVVGTFLLALKADATATLAIDAIRAGEKPIITVANTMEMFITEYAKESGVGIGDKLNATFADVLKRYLDKTRKARIKHANGDTEIVWLTDAQLGVDGVDAYNSALEFIEDMDMDIPLSPIDHIKQKIEEAGFSIGEITGRQTVLEKGVLKGRNKAEMKTSGKKNTIAKYNGGPLDALIINRSGSTGLSMHASATFADQRRRVMIIAQAELDINNHMQMLGRTNRTGQVTTGPYDAGLTGVYQGRAAQYGLPRYAQMTADVPIELRPAAVLSNKMAGLNANTTAGRKGAVQDKTALDFMNKYGDRVAAELVGNNFALNERLGFPIRTDEHGDPFIPGSMGRVTGRIGLLPLAQQTELYGQLATEYTDLLAQLDALGQNELEAKTYPLDAETLESKVVQKADKGSISPFTSAVSAEKVSMKKLGKPYPRAKVEELIQSSLKGQEARELQRQTVALVTTQINAEILALQEEKATAIAERQATIDKHIDGLTAATLKFRQSLPPIGAEVLLKTSAGNMYGVVTGIEKTGKAKSAGSLSAWKIKFSVVDGARSMTLPLTQIFTDESAPMPESGIVMKAATDITMPNAERNGFETVPVMEAFDRGQTDARETRIIITGNILRGYGALRGRMLNYTDNKGGIKQGILMPPDFDMNTVSAKFAPSLKNSDEAIALLKKGGTVIDKANAGDTLRVEWKGGESFIIEVSKTGLGKRLAKKAEGLNFVSSGNKMRVRVWSSETLKDFLDNTAKPEGIILVPNADSVKLMQDDTGTAFSLGASSTGLPHAKVSSIVNAIRSQWENSPDVVVAASMDDPVIPQSVRDYDQLQKSQGAQGEPDGFVHRGKVYLIADQLPEASDVIRVLFHEALGHKGLRGAYGDELKPILQQVATMRRKEVSAKASQYGLDMSKESDRLAAAEEVLAEMAQTRPEIGFVTRAVSLIRAWLRKHVPGFSNLALTDNDIIAQFLIPARRYIEGRGTEKQQGAAGQLAFGRGTNEAMTNNDVVGNSQGTPADGKTTGPLPTSLFETIGLTERGRALINSSAEALATRLRNAGFEVDLQHSGSIVGPSSYLRIYDPQTGRTYPLGVRLSGHSKGAFNSQEVWNVSKPSEFDRVMQEAIRMRNLGPSSALLVMDERERNAVKIRLASADKKMAKGKPLTRSEQDAVDARNNQGGRSADDSTPGAAKQSDEDIAREIDRVLQDTPGSWEWGIRVIPRNSKSVTVGDVLEPSIDASQALEEDGIYDQKLDGTSTLGVSTYEDASDHLATFQDAKSTYSGSQIVLVKGSSATRGEDSGEKIIRDPEVVLILRERKPNESTASDSGGAMFSRTKIVGETSRQHTPEQLRAMKNVGFQVEVPTLKERAQAIWKDAGKKLAQGIADQFAPIKDMDTKAYGLMRLAKGASGAFESLLHGGLLKLSDNVYDFDETKRGGVIDKLLIPLQGEHHDFMRWVAANRAERLMGDGKEHLFSPQDVADLKTLATGQAAFDYTIQNGIRRGMATRDRAEIYRDSLMTFNIFNKNVLDMAEQSGMIDAGSRAVWEHEFYVPFYRVADDSDGGVRGMNIKGGVVRQQAFKQLKGGKGALNADLLDNTLMNWAHLLDASAKNRAAKATIEAAERLGVAIGGNQATLAQMGSSVNNKNGVVWFMDGGMKRYSLIDNQGDGAYLMTAITALEYAGMRSPIMNAMGFMKNALTIGVTASPFFKVRNLIRDSVQVIGTSGINVNPLANVAQGWKLTNPKSDAYFRLLAGGGTIHFGTMLEGSESKRVQALVESGVDAGTILNDEHKVKAFYRKFIEPGITAYNELGNRGEAVNRASLYAQLVKQGMTHAEASLQARDLMDFSMQGSFTSIRFLSQVVPFFNARIQGMYKLGRAAKEDPARFSAVIGAAAVISLGLLAAYSDDDDWKRRADWDRNNFWWFKFGGTAFRIPKPFEIGAIATLAERGFELAFDKEMTTTAFRKQVMTLLGDNLSMNPIPQIVKPIIDVYANKDSFSGNPIESMSMERLKSEYRFNDRTSMTARGLSTAANSVTGIVGVETLSPVQIDHMLRGYFGWLGAFIVGAGDKLARPATGQTEQAAPDYWKTVTGSMVSDLRDAPSKYVSNMYEQAKVIEQAYGTWRSLVKQGDRQGAAEFAADNKELMRKYHQVEAIKRTESKLNEHIRFIERSDISADEKRTQIRRIRNQQELIAKRLAPV